MADIKVVRIESLPATTAVTEDDYLVVQQPDLTCRVKLAMLSMWMGLFLM